MAAIIIEALKGISIGEVMITGIIWTGNILEEVITNSMNTMSGIVTGKDIETEDGIKNTKPFLAKISFTLTIFLSGKGFFIYL